MTIILNGTTGITTPGITNQGVVEFTAGSVGAPSLTTTSDTNTGIYFPAADTIAFTEGGVESMRIDSSGQVGIGMTPARKLDVTGTFGVTGAATFGNTGVTNGLINSNDGLYFAIDADNDDANDNNNFLWLKDTATGSGGTTLMTLRATGNLGLGVTPSAWSATSGYRAMQIGGVGIYGRDAAVNELYLTSNAFNSATGFKYIYTASATRYDQDTGKHIWYNAASGTAGNAISFTQAMTLDSSGNLGIGTTTIGSRVTIGDPGTGLSFSNATATSGFNIGLLAGTGSAQAYVFSRDNAALLFGTNNTERARFTAAGEFLLGATAAVDG